MTKSKKNILLEVPSASSTKKGKNTPLIKTRYKKLLPEFARKFLKQKEPY